MNSTSSIFIAGNSRSGTTMMGRILGNNEKVFTFHELHFFEQLWDPQRDSENMSKEGAVVLFSKLISLQRQGYLQQRTPETFYSEAESVIGQMQQRLRHPFVFEEFLLNESRINGKEIPCEQTPRNVFFINEILELYPNAKVVCMMRDPRDILLSQKNKWKRRFLGAKTIPLKESIRSWINYHPITISKLWNSSASKIFSAQNLDRVHIVQFEQLIENPEAIIKLLCNFLGLNYSASMLAVPQVGSSTGSDQPETKGIRKDNTGGFINGLNNAEIFYCQRITRSMRQKFGYEDLKISNNYLMILWYALTFPVKIFFALLFNLRRTRNLINTIKRRF